MQSRFTTTRWFIFALAAAGALYLLFEFFFNQYAMISVDEFWFAHRIYQYKSGLPYRDFSPYKTVLGYYLLLLPMLSSQGLFKTLIFTKQVLAIINAAALLAAARWLSRFFSYRDVLAGLCLLLSSEIVLSYSTQIRVDLLAYWFCLFAILCLLEKRFVLAGLLIGLGFMTSQKVIWYLFASNIGLICAWSFHERDFRFFRNIVIYNVTAILVMASYVALWSAVADFGTVWRSVFLEASAMYQLDWYSPARKIFWYVILLFNPFLFLIAPFTLTSLVVTYPGDQAHGHRLIIVPTAIVILCCLIPYQQVFPYYMQVTIPAFLLLYAAFFSWLDGIYHARAARLLVPEPVFYVLLLISLGVMLAPIALFHLPLPYWIITLFPLLTAVLITRADKLTDAARYLIKRCLLIILVFIGTVYPLTLFTAKLINLNSDYQKANITAANAWLQDGGDYVAGIELIYNKTQPIAGMRHLIGPAIDYLSNPSEKLRAVMTASQYEDPAANVDSVIAALKQSRVKFYINNYRMAALPPRVKHFLDSDYLHFWGSIYAYAPVIPAGRTLVYLKFTGKYQVIGDQMDIYLDGKRYRRNTVIPFNEGMHRSWATAHYRLRLVLNQTALRLDPAFKQDTPEKVIF